jgi:DNA mismatch endonuclease (patch repair protein)
MVQAAAAAAQGMAFSMTVVAAGRDRLSPEDRSRLMSRIRGRDTKPEMLVRRGLFRLGFRYRLHRADLPGRPDLVFPGHHAVIFVHGCFWHGHGCHLFRHPSGNAAFWRAKIDGNVARDSGNQKSLAAAGWRVFTVWECALRGRQRLATEAVIIECARWLCSDELVGQLTGLDLAHG